MTETTKMFEPIDKLPDKLRMEVAVSDPFNEADYKQLAKAVKEHRDTAIMAGHKMLVRYKTDGVYVFVTPANGNLLPCGSIEIERLLRIYG